MPRSRTKCYNLYMFLYSYSYKRLSWWWWCVRHPLFLTIRSASNGCEVSCGIFATIAHFSAPICRKPLIILKATTSLPHLIKTAREIYFEWKVINKSVFYQVCEQVLLFYYFGSVTTHGHIASKRKRSVVSASHPHTPGNQMYSTARPARHIA